MGKISDRRRRAAVVAGALALSLTPGPAWSAAARALLAARAPAEGPLGPGQRDCYDLPGSGVVLTLEASRGAPVLELGGGAAARRYRFPLPESPGVRLPTDQAAATVCVVATEDMPVPGRYRLTLTKAAPPGAVADALAVQARAAAAFADGAAPERARAADGFRDAATRWTRIGEYSAAALARAQEGEIRARSGQPSDAVAAYSEALALLGGGDPALAQLEAAILLARGLTRIDLGLNEDARADFEAARTGFRAAGDAGREAEALNGIALSAHYAGRHDEALDWYRQALDLPVTPVNYERIARINNNIGGIHYGRGDADEALAYFDASYAAHRELGNDFGRMGAAGNTASLYRLIGEWDAALERYEEARALATTLQDRRMEARALSGLGRTYHALGRESAAQDYLRRALELRRATEDAKGEASTLSALGETYLAAGDLESARAVYGAALRIRQELEDRPRYAEPLLGLAEVERRSGAPDAAQAYAGEAVAAARATGRRREEAESLYALGLAQAAAGSPGAARPTLAAALALGAEVRSPEVTTASRVELARLDVAAGDLVAARERTTVALGEIESLRRRIAAPQLRATYLGMQDAAYELHTDIEVALGRADPDGPGLAAALTTVERNRARVLLDLLREHRADLATLRDPKLRARRRALQRQARAIAARLATAATADPAAETRLTETLRALDDLEADARRASPRYARLTTPPALDIAALQRQLGPDRALLEFDLGSDRAYLFALTQGRLAVYDLPPPAEVEAAVMTYYEAIARLDADGRDAERALASQLATMLLAPAAEFLQARDLAFVPDGVLHYLPFATLPLPQTGEPLAASRSVVQLPSARLLLEHGSGGPIAPEATIAILADPVFGPDDPRLPPGAAAPARDQEWLARLPATALEADAVAARFPPERRLVATGTAASRGLLIGGELAPYSVLHFATHGVFDGDHPLVSGLTFSRYGATGEPVDGFFGVYDAHDLETSAELVVLSGCETALGRELRAEGLVGLTHGFMYAGVRRVVATLWQVPERATVEVMTAFYEGLIGEGLSPASALAAAQARLARSGRWRDPFYWGGFTLQGVW